jgi:hypothetical protein
MTDTDSNTESSASESDVYDCESVSNSSLTEINTSISTKSNGSKEVVLSYSQETHASDLLDYDGPSNRARYLRILNKFNEEKVSLAKFIYDIVGYGDSAIRNEKRIKRARHDFFTSTLFDDIILNLIKPPRTDAKGRRSKNCSEATRRCLSNITTDILRQELSSFGSTLRLKAIEDDAFDQPDPDTPRFLKEISSDLYERAPTLVNILRSITAHTKKASDPKLKAKDNDHDDATGDEVCIQSSPQFIYTHSSPWIFIRSLSRFAVS